MAGPPCKCSTCGLVFETGLVEIEDGVLGSTFQNCSVSCPRCGGLAKIGDGTYDSVGEVLKLVSGPSDTFTLVAELEKIATNARNKGLTAQDILTEIAGVSPDLATKLNGIGPWPVVGLLLFLFWIVKSVTLDINVDFNWLIDQAWHISHGEDPDAHLDSLPPQFPDGPASHQSPFPEPIIAHVTTTPLNRQARRRAAAQKRRSRKG